MGIDRYSFHFNQNQLEEMQTLDELEMEDVDVIDVVPLADHINIKVRGQDGNTVRFKMKRNTQLKGLMEAYCNHQSLEKDQIRFLFDGNRLRETESSEDLDMEDNDQIDATRFQVGSIGIFAQHRGRSRSGAARGKPQTLGKPLQPTLDGSSTTFARPARRL